LNPTSTPQKNPNSEIPLPEKTKAVTAEGKMFYNYDCFRAIQTPSFCWFEVTNNILCTLCFSSLSVLGLFGSY